MSFYSKSLFKKGMMAKSKADLWNVLFPAAAPGLPGSPINVPLTGPGGRFPVKLPIDQVFALFFARQKWTFKVDLTFSGTTYLFTYSGGDYDSASYEDSGTINSNLSAPYGWSNGTASAYVPLESEGGLGGGVGSGYPLPSPPGALPFRDRFSVEPIAMGYFEDFDNTNGTLASTEIAYRSGPDSTSVSTTVLTGSSTGTSGYTGVSTTTTVNTPGGSTTTSLTDQYVGVVSMVALVQIGGFNNHGVDCFAVLDDSDPGYAWLGLEIQLYISGLTAFAPDPLVTSPAWWMIENNGATSDNFAALKAGWVPSSVVFLFDGTPVPLFFHDSFSNYSTTSTGSTGTGSGSINGTVSLTTSNTPYTP